MAFIQQPALATRPVTPHTAIRPRVPATTPRRIVPWKHPLRRIPAPLGAIQPDADLMRYPNGQPLKTIGMGSFVRVQGPTHGPQGRPMLSGLRGYQSAPDLTQYTNGRPLPAIGNQTPKATLVMMAFDRCMSKKSGQRGGCACSSGVPTMSKHRGMMGLGDDGSGAVLPPDSSTISSDPTVLPPDSVFYPDTYGSDVVIPTAGDNAPPTSVWSETPSGGIALPGMAQAATTPTASTIGNTLSNLVRSLFGSGTTYAVPAYSSVGVTGLSSPIYAGSSVSTGGALLLGGGGLLLLVLAMKKR